MYHIALLFNRMISFELFSKISTGAQGVAGRSDFLNKRGLASLKQSQDLFCCKYDRGQHLLQQFLKSEVLEVFLNLRVCQKVKRFWHSGNQPLKY